ncbi:hypothetical protein GCM10016272_03920 [Psychrobacter glaciei]|uniref:Lipoprotein n=1 Tax=Psychrobacter glaciei TaxID=619771 RepID=A0ABQ3GNE4_9GAMM|nr:hypothetical protein [Psychrobacter glaciei]GHD26711.1 hypothetical protein GCM10016272_03920 [Psychrobacter glaciei]
MKSVLLGCTVALALLAGCESNAGNKSSDIVLSEEAVGSEFSQEGPETEIVSKLQYDSNGIIVCGENNDGVCTDDVLQDLRTTQLREQHDASTTPLSEVSNITIDKGDDDSHDNATRVDYKEITGPLTPAQAAHIDYLVDNDLETSQEMIDLLNDFTLDGSEESSLRKFIIERSRYKDGYDASEDCRNPDLTEAEYANACT